MTIKPTETKLKLLIDEVKVGAIQTETIAERAVVIDVGHADYEFLKGRVIYFKAWAVDVITHEGEKHYFIDANSTAICGYETN